jgi:hypothetical protein
MNSGMHKYIFSSLCGEYLARASKILEPFNELKHKSTANMIA